MNLVDVPTIEAATQAALDKGVRQFQIHLAGATDREHVQVLLDEARLPPNARVLDAGCGIGESLRLMCEERPDLVPTLLNLSPLQLALCPAHMTRLQADFHRMPIPSESMDAVLHMHSLCQSSDVVAALSEAHRVLASGGTLFIVDLVDTGGADHGAWLGIGAAVHRRADLEAQLRSVGFTIDTWRALPKVVDQLAILDPELDMGHGLESVAIRATKNDIGGV